MPTTNVNPYSYVSKRGRPIRVRQHVRGYRPGAAETKRLQEQEELDYLRGSDPVLTVVAYGPGMDASGVTHVHQGEVGGKIRSEFNGDGDESEAVARELIGGTHFVHSDAWRGTFHTPDSAGDLVKVMDTWVSPQGHSGDYETQHQVPLEELITRWKTRESRPPMDVFVAYTPTSNVFSVGFDVYVHRGDRERAVKYLREANVDPRDLKT